MRAAAREIERLQGELDRAKLSTKGVVRRVETAMHGAKEKLDDATRRLAVAEKGVTQP